MMKKEQMRSVCGRRVIAAILSAGMLLPLTGCKKKTNKKKDLYSQGRIIEATDPYFTDEVNRLQIPVDPKKTIDTLYVSSCEYTGDYAIATYALSYKVPEETKKRIDSAQETGSEYEFDPAEYFVQGTAIFDGEGRLIKQLVSGEDTIYGEALDKDGNIHMLYSHLEPLEFDPSMTPEQMEELVKNQHFDIKIGVFDSAGNTVSETVLGDIDTEGWGGWKQSFSILPNDTYAYSTSGKILIFDKEGRKICEVTDMDRLIEGNIICEDGKYYILSRNQNLNDGLDYQIKEVDITNGALKSGTSAGDLSAYETITANKDGLFLNSYGGCFKYDIKTGKIEEIFNWNDTDVDRSLLKNVQCIPVNENEFLAVGHKSYQIDYPYLIRMTRAETNPHAGKKLVVIGGENLSSCGELLAFISRYSSDPKNGARVVVVDYTSGLDASEGYGDIEQTIYLDTLAGTGPDILMNVYDSVAFRSDTIMEDMNQYLDGEQGINRADYFDNILRACETDGKLYHIPIRFELDGLMANKKYISNTEGWTYDEFFAASKEVPDQVSFLEGTLYNDLLRLLLGTSLPRFVDYENKKVDLDNEDMKKILETVKQYGVTKIPDDEGWYYEKKEFADGSSIEGDGDHTEVKFKEGMLAIVTSAIAGGSDIAARRHRYSEDLEYLGYPSMEKTGMAAKPTLSMGIVASSKSKGVAWDFIKAFMESETSDSQIPYTAHIRRAEFDLENQTIMKRANANYYQIFEDSPYVAEELSYLVNEEDIQEAKALIEKTTVSSGGDPVIFDIICEEAAGYFTSNRSVEDVLKNIQNRAMTVVKER